MNDDNLKMYNILMAGKSRKEEAAMKRAEQRRKARERQRRNDWLWKVAILALAVALFTIAAFAISPKKTEMVETWNDGWSEPAITAKAEAYAEAEYDGETENENELIEAALFESGYFRDDVPLDGDTQAELHAACDEFGIEYTLALAVIQQETGFRNVTGDGGNSIGYMQLQPRWNGARMSELGVTDLSVPYQNFRTGCSLLRELLDKYGTETRALTAYNTGKPGTSSYARSVLAYKAGFES